jgi:hypothetical protein
MRIIPAASGTFRMIKRTLLATVLVVSPLCIAAITAAFSYHTGPKASQRQQVARVAPAAFHSVQSQ